jgi:hypothetical protein
LGILHPRGRRSVDFLRGASVEVPASWQVEQDHQRRGLIIRVDPQTPPSDVVRWTCRAVGVLSLPAVTGNWRAVVHLPREPRNRE